MGFFDLAHRTYATAVLQGALQKAGRDSTLETGGANTAAIDTAVKNQVFKITGTKAQFASVRQSYTDFTNVGTPEVFKDKAPLNGKYDAGECFEDLNGNGQWDADVGKNGQGSAQDAVVYKVTITYDRVFPMAKLLGWNPKQVITSSTVLRNQPYGDQTIPSVAKCP
jgi:hypothetical protein